MIKEFLIKNKIYIKVAINVSTLALLVFIYKEHNLMVNVIMYLITVKLFILLIIKLMEVHGRDR